MYMRMKSLWLSSDNDEKDSVQNQQHISLMEIRQPNVTLTITIHKITQEAQLIISEQMNVVLENIFKKKAKVFLVFRFPSGVALSYRSHMNRIFP